MVKPPPSGHDLLACQSINLAELLEAAEASDPSLAENWLWADYDLDAAINAISQVSNQDSISCSMLSQLGLHPHQR